MIGGTLVRWDDARGFGFVAPHDGGPEVFMHIKALPPGARRPEVGERFAFDIEVVDGKKRAVRVLRPQAVRPLRKRNPATQWGGASLLLIPLFLILLAGLGLFWKMPRAWMAFYAVASLANFGLYAWDKAAARRGARRTPESTLHLWSLLGGWPGALLAQQYLRHKSVKTAFRNVFRATVVLNVLALVVLASPAGRAWLAGVAG